MERQLVEKYLRTQGHSLRSVRELPDALRRPLLAAAARYASLQMTECETGHRSINAGIPKTWLRPGWLLISCDSYPRLSEALPC
jgi:hypothetical protein